MTEKPQLTLYNSLTRKKEVFTPQDPKRVTMYNCGPTVYSYAHIGNARAAVVADVLFRVLRHIYGEDHVIYARNITDVDDKIIESAKEQGVDISVITEKYAKIYNEDLAAIGCLPPTAQPKATEHIQEMADIIITLMDKDIAYASEGHVLFDVTKMDDYGKLSGRKLDDNLAGARVVVASYKRNAGDFVLWKPAKSGEPGWGQQEGSEIYKVDWKHYGNRDFANSPGRPGWHIECSAMAKAALCDEEYGNTIDIHCGGIDLKFPHHENEIAQSECANEEQFSKFWVHNEFLNMGSEKMSKSLGNVKLIHDLLKEWDGEVIRLALLKAHYRSELVWTEKLLEESKVQLDKAYRVLGGVKEVTGISDLKLTIDQWPASFLDDLNTPHILSKIFENIGALSIDVQVTQDQLSADLSVSGRKMLVEANKDYYIPSASNSLGGLMAFGLLQKDTEDWFKGGASSDDQAEFDAIALRRQEARAAKDWAAADAARDEATAKGIVLEDGPDGTTWRKA